MSEHGPDLDPTLRPSADQVTANSGDTGSGSVGEADGLFTADPAELSASSGDEVDIEVFGIGEPGFAGVDRSVDEVSADRAAEGKLDALAAGTRSASPADEASGGRAGEGELDALAAGARSASPGDEASAGWAADADRDTGSDQAGSASPVGELDVPGDETALEVAASFGTDAEAAARSADAGTTSRDEPPSEVSDTELEPSAGDAINDELLNGQTVESTTRFGDSAASGSDAGSQAARASTGSVGQISTGGVSGLEAVHGESREAHRPESPSALADVHPPEADGLESLPAVADEHLPEGPGPETSPAVADVQVPEGHGSESLPAAADLNLPGAGGPESLPAAADLHLAEADRPESSPDASGPLRGTDEQTGATADALVPPDAGSAGSDPDVPSSTREQADGSAGGGEVAEVAVPSADPPQDDLADPERLRAALEAVLLVVDVPTSSTVLAQVLQRPVADIDAALRELRDGYDADRRGMDLREVADGWRLYSRDEFAVYVERFVLDGQQARLTQAALETLAVIAYRQPVTRSRISAIRGVSVDAVMRTLLTRGLVEECGADPDTGGGLYRTTRLFLEKLGLRSLEELPSLAPLLPDTSQLDDVAVST